jgi:hypothetical protein
LLSIRHFARCGRTGTRHTRPGESEFLAAANLLFTIIINLSVSAGHVVSGVSDGVIDDDHVTCVNDGAEPVCFEHG